ncbi:MAG: hypothetical protein COA57_01050 [Flavobacteriales bacterium]|nr:MAG: hypothetical protein COA57_01050 [Flavobacteriales bacterium]
MLIDPQKLIYAGRGSTALWAILKAHNSSSSNGKILVPANICEIVIPIIKNAGMKPVYYDVDPIQGNADINHIQDAFTGDEKILLAVHNFGTPLPIKQIAVWAKNQNVFLIEDVCNALGANYENKPLGTLGDAAIFSFGYAKIIEKKTGGALLIKNNKLKKVVNNTLTTLPIYNSQHHHFDQKFQIKLKEIRKDARKFSPKFYVPLYEEYVNHLFYQINQELITEIQQDMETLQENIDRRKQIATGYREKITNPLIQHRTPVDGEIFWRYSILAANTEMRNTLIRKLRTNNLLASTWYPPVNHLFEKKGNESDFKGAYFFSQRVINLFVDKRVNKEAIDKTIDIINNFK